MLLTELLPPAGANDPDALYEAFVTWTAADSLTLYPHQDEAVIDILTGLGFSIIEAQTALQHVPREVRAMDERVQAALQHLDQTGQR